jgi:hypothetical protein
MGRHRSAFGNGGVKSHTALCKSVSQVSSTDSTRTEEDDTTTVSSSSGGSSGSLATALQTEIRRRAAEKSTPGNFTHVFAFYYMLLCFDDLKLCLSFAFAVMVYRQRL